MTVEQILLLGKWDIYKKNVVENVQTDGQWTFCFVRFNHPGKKGLMSIETLHKEAFLALCDWKGYEETNKQQYKKTLAIIRAIF